MDDLTDINYIPDFYEFFCEKVEENKFWFLLGFSHCVDL